MLSDLYPVRVTVLSLAYLGPFLERDLNFPERCKVKREQGESESERQNREKSACKSKCGNCIRHSKPTSLSQSVPSVYPSFIRVRADFKTAADRALVTGFAAAGPPRLLCGVVVTSHHTQY